MVTMVCVQQQLPSKIRMYYNCGVAGFGRAYSVADVPMSIVISAMRAFCQNQSTSDT